MTEGQKDYRRMSIAKLLDEIDIALVSAPNQAELSRRVRLVAIELRRRSDITTAKREPFFGREKD